MAAPRTITAFLRARIREEETAALDARRWFEDGAGPVSGTAVAAARPMTESFAAFVLAHDPDRVLRDCIARRRIIDLVTGNGWAGSRDHADEVLRLLALPYAGHPDFKERWDAF